MRVIRLSEQLFLFACTFSPSTTGAIPFAELGKQIASNWKSLSASERKKYEEEANADKERYAREMEENNKIMAASDIGGPPIRKRGDNAGGGGKRGQHNSYYEEEQPMNIGPPTPYYDPYFGGYGRPPPPPGAIGGEGYGHPGELIYLPPCCVGCSLSFWFCTKSNPVCLNHVLLPN